MRWIYLSPHLDDAVLSCGGLIHEQSRQGTPVEIWTLMAGYSWRTRVSDFAARLHADWGTGPAWRTVYLRRREDRQAARLVGARARHFRFLDMIYRRSPKGVYLYTEDVFVQPHPSDCGLPNRIAEAVGHSLELEDVLVCPLAIGAHLDHVLVRTAAEGLRRPLWYYADVPYLFQHPESLDPATRGMTSTLFPIMETGLQAWQAGISAYASQLSTLFNGDVKMPEAMRAYWGAEEGLRLWRVE
jgi:LmbE family N-acetylglucosaminyl deacetylase